MSPLCTYFHFSQTFKILFSMPKGLLPTGSVYITYLCLYLFIFVQNSLIHLYVCTLCALSHIWKDNNVKPIILCWYHCQTHSPHSHVLSFSHTHKYKPQISNIHTWLYSNPLMYFYVDLQNNICSGFCVKSINMKIHTHTQTAITHMYTCRLPGIRQYQWLDVWMEKTNVRLFHIFYVADIL